MRRNSRVMLSVFYWGFMVYLFVPLVLMTMMSFKDSKFIGFPIRGWTAKWYGEALSNGEVLSVFTYSVTIALASTLVALVMGTWIAVLLERKGLRGRAVIFALAVLPALVPGIISAISFRIYARQLGIEPGMFAVIWSHAVHGVPFVALVVVARLSTLPRAQLEAAQDLGADPVVRFVRIVLPYLVPALIGAGVFCILQSLDDFVRSFFLGGYQPTLPVMIFAKLRSGMSPEINAISTIVLVLTAAMGLWAERSMRRMRKDNP